ncbi:hypothetical protein KIW84_051697 [Lathyrus oleraceus]|uniref:PHD finger protein ALFIN-LIKE n=1 Tax=Pisum sativum TaxID=3888 RepID=A0A9D4WPT7_PEA|nr:hypothetical protein KIW84_051697 [Pisum sativum]
MGSRYVLWSWILKPVFKAKYPEIEESHGSDALMWVPVKPPNKGSDTVTNGRQIDSTKQCNNFSEAYDCYKGIANYYEAYNQFLCSRVFGDFKGRRAGLIKALTTDVEDFYNQCDPDKENLCLYGFPSEQWEVNLPAEEVPPELPEPVLGINFARDSMPEKDWLSLVVVHSDSWLLAIAYYFGARFGFDNLTGDAFSEEPSGEKRVKLTVTAKGKPSETYTYADIETVYKYLEENFGAKQEDIILYGQSVGSGPTLDIAARLPQLRAVILHSPILSGLRVMYPVKPKSKAKAVKAKTAAKPKSAAIKPKPAAKSKAPVKPKSKAKACKGCKDIDEDVTGKESCYNSCRRDTLSATKIQS